MGSDPPVSNSTSPEVKYQSNTSATLENPLAQLRENRTNAGGASSHSRPSAAAFVRRHHTRTPVVRGKILIANTTATRSAAPRGAEAHAGGHWLRVAIRPGGRADVHGLWFPNVSRAKRRGPA